MSKLFQTIVGTDDYIDCKGLEEFFIMIFGYSGKIWCQVAMMLCFNLG